MAKRNKHSRWRRLPSVFRFGDHKLPDPNLEPQRLTVYLAGSVLDAAEAQAARAGAETVQEYCTELLIRALEAQQIREQVADVEARRGPLEGLQQISDDPEFLAELSAQTALIEHQKKTAPPVEPIAHGPTVISIPSQWHAVQELADEQAKGSAHPTGEVVVKEPVVAAMSLVKELEGPAQFTRSAEVILRHAGQIGDDPQGFLPCLRRGGPLSLEAIAELARALNALEREHRNAKYLDRRVTFALHRLAYEGQVLHTDAWPGTFDEWTVETLRAVQESVERILSGQDIRYFPAESRPEFLH